ncbi:restriction endonuclease subunit S [soil metagenome]
MTEAWQSCTVRDLIESGEAKVKTGPFGTQLRASDYVAVGTPVINVRNVGFGEIRPEKLEYIAEKTVARLSTHLLEPGDIVFGRKGAVERHAFIQEQQSRWFQGSDCIRLRLTSNRILPRFVSYKFLTEAHKQWMLSQGSHGATMASLKQDIIGRIPLAFPPLEVQHRIVEVLSAHDDLIENNARRMAILEEMARAIYREWFVDFRFPGHDQVEMVESELGPVPAGWEVRRIGDVVETLGGGTPSTKVPEYWEGGDITWFSPTDLTGTGAMFISDSDKKITAVGLQKSSAKLFPPYSVMMTSRATIGVIAINTRVTSTNQGFITCVPNKRLTVYQIYFWIADTKEKIISLASGATFKEINKATFRDLPVLVADGRVTQRFADTVGPIGKQIDTLLSKNHILRITRDLLLPKLISGEVDVSAMDETLPEAAA